MKRLYTLEEIHRYAYEIRLTNEDLWKAIDHHDAEQKNQIQAELHVMHEVLLRMHEALEKYGPYRPGLFGRWLAAREIRKGVAKIAKQQGAMARTAKAGEVLISDFPSDLQAEILANSPKLHAVTDREGRTTIMKEERY